MKHISTPLYLTILLIVAALLVGYSLGMPTRFPRAEGGPVSSSCPAGVTVTCSTSGGGEDTPQAIDGGGRIFPFFNSDTDLINELTPPLNSPFNYSPSASFVSPTTLIPSYQTPPATDTRDPYVPYTYSTQMNTTPSYSTYPASGYSPSALDYWPGQHGVSQ